MFCQAPVVRRGVMDVLCLCNVEPEPPGRVLTPVTGPDHRWQETEISRALTLTGDGRTVTLLTLSTYSSLTTEV